MLPRILTGGIGKGRFFWERLRLRRQLNRRPWEMPPGPITLHYGGVLSSRSGRPLHGGKIKLIHLDRVFPESDIGFHILYLVSSAQPHFADAWIRWAKGHGAKLVWNQNGVAYPAWAGPATAGNNRNLKDLFHRADFVIYQSDFCRTSADRYLGPVQAPWEVVYNCIDTRRFFPARPELPSSPWVLLAIGTHQQPERVLSVLKTLAILRNQGRNARLVLAGVLDWPQAEQQVGEALHRFGLNGQVTFRPAYTQEEAPEIYRMAHILVHPKYKDPCPTVCLEALACGLPVIGSRSGGMPELVGTEAGILLDLPDSWEKMHYPTPAAMARAVETIASQWPDWSRKARLRAQSRFDCADWVERHHRIFQRVLGLSERPI
jgi:glycosyltransferase involved in cell wall biosynthesis